MFGVATPSKPLVWWCRSCARPSPDPLGGSKVMYVVKKAEWETAWERDYVTISCCLTMCMSNLIAYTLLMARSNALETKSLSRYPPFKRAGHNKSCLQVTVIWQEQIVGYYPLSFKSYPLNRTLIHTNFTSHTTGFSPPLSSHMWLTLTSSSPQCSATFSSLLWSSSKE